MINLNFKIICRETKNTGIEESIDPKEKQKIAWRKQNRKRSMKKLKKDMKCLKLEIKYQKESHCETTQKYKKVRSVYRKQHSEIELVER